MLHAVQVALFDDVAVFGSKFGQHAPDTFTQRDDGFGLLIRLGSIVRQLGGFPMQALMINQRIARDLK